MLASGVSFERPIATANDVYRIDLLASGSTTVFVSDDGTGIDRLEIQGSDAFATDIRLNYRNSFPICTDASGLFFTPGVTHTLVVSGLIPNVRGCDSADYIADNLLYGDHDNGLGGNGTLGGGTDTAMGGSGNDTLSGDGGKDKLTGSLGADLLAGGAAADRFIYLSASDSTASAAGRDTISNFNHAPGDQIDRRHCTPSFRRWAPTTPSRPAPKRRAFWAVGPM